MRGTRLGTEALSLVRSFHHVTDHSLTPAQCVQTPPLATVVERTIGSGVHTLQRRRFLPQHVGGVLPSAERF